MNRKWYGFCFVFITVFVCFLPGLNNNLLDWDDAGYIVENTSIHLLSFKTVKWAFSSFYLNYWAPLTWLSLSLDYAVWGLDPFGYHLTNNILHALNAGIFFLICLELLSYGTPLFRSYLATKSNISVALLCSGLAALYFGVHPLRVESVAWVTERKDVLSLLFGLLCVLFYLRHVRIARSWSKSGEYWASLAFFALSLCSKSLMVTLPMMLLVLDWFPLRRLHLQAFTRVVCEKAPYFFLSAMLSFITMTAQAGVIEPITLSTRVLNAFRSITSYLWLTIWPFDVSPFYVHPFNIAGITFEYAMPIAVFMVITICCLLLLRRQPVFMAVWLIYLVSLLPFLGLTQQIGAQALAGRFTYCAGLPLALLFAIGAIVVYERCSGFLPGLIALASGVALILFVNVYLTVRDISFWKDDVTLWTRVIELSPNTGRAYFQRSHAYRLTGESRKALLDIDKAISIAENKQYRAMHDLYRARAGIYVDMREYSRAIADYSRALETATDATRNLILYERDMAYRQAGQNKSGK